MYPYKDNRNYIEISQRTKRKEVCGKIPAKNKNAGYTQKLFKKILNDIHMGIGYEWIYLSI